MRKRCLVISGILCLLLCGCGTKQTVKVQDVRATVAYMDNFTEYLTVQPVGNSTIDVKNISRIVAEVVYDNAEEGRVCNYMVDVDSHTFYEYDPSKGYNAIDISKEHITKIQDYVNKFGYIKNQTIGSMESTSADVKWKIVAYSRDGSIIVNQGVCQPYEDVPYYVTSIRDIIGGF